LFFRFLIVHSFFPLTVKNLSYIIFVSSVFFIYFSAQALIVSGYIVACEDFFWKVCGLRVKFVMPRWSGCCAIADSR